MKWTPLKRSTGEWFEQLRSEMDQLLHRFLREGGSAGRGGAMGWNPQVDVEETDREIVIKVDLPGVDPLDIEIALAEGALIIQGKKEEERQETKKNFHVVERQVGRFYRTIPLPLGADPELVQAVTAKGVLTITVPKKPEMQPKKIMVQSGE